MFLRVVLADRTTTYECTQVTVEQDDDLGNEILLTLDGARQVVAQKDLIGHVCVELLNGEGQTIELVFEKPADPR